MGSEHYYSKGYCKGLAPEPRLGFLVSNIFGKLKGGRLLDIGCGDGCVTLLLKEIMGAEEVFGVDIAHEAVLAAREKGIKAYQMDMDKDRLPFNDEYFDVIYCGEIIEHVFDPDHLLEEVRRVLKRDKFMSKLPSLSTRIIMVLEKE